MKKRLALGVMLSGILTGPGVAASLPARAPGLWQSTTTATGPDGQPLPDASHVVTVSCVTAETDQKFFLSKMSACTKFSLIGSGSQYAIDGTCTQQGKPVTIHEALNYANAQAVTLVAELTTPTGLLTVTTQLQWQGDCPAGMAPGDEGSMSGGVFSKTDNINDPANQ